MSLSTKAYFVKFFQSLRNYGVLETFYLCRSFAVKNLKLVFFSIKFFKRYKAIRYTSGLLHEKSQVIADVQNFIQASLLQAPIDIQYSCLYGQMSDFTGERTVVVAHCDPHGIVDPYIRYMCTHFKELGWRVVLASSNMLSTAIEDLECEGWVDAAICCPDINNNAFVSWKVALNCFSTLYNSKELILCDDSIFGPVGSFQDIHDQMNKVDCDFWGLTESKRICSHIQSYYMVFRSTSLEHKAFKNFINAIPCSECEVECLEPFFTLWLALHGLRPAVALPLPRCVKTELDPAVDLWSHLIRIGVPVFKRECLSLSNHGCKVHGWNSLLGEKKYPIGLIFKYFSRIGKDISTSLCPGVRYASFPPDVLSLSKPVELSPLNSTRCLQTKFAVIIHCFYTEILPELVEYLKNIPDTASLFVSTTSSDKAEEIESTLAQLSFASLEVRVLPNCGWDIMPFFVGFRDVLQDYDVILKIHAKKSLQLEADKAQGWRALLYNSLMGSKERVQSILAYLEEHQDCGVISAPTWIGLPEIAQGCNHTAMKRILQVKGIALPRAAAIDFPAGSMFWARAKALKPWLDLGLAVEDFGDSASAPRDGTLAHALERLIYFGCGIQGMYWGRVS